MSVTFKPSDQARSENVRCTRSRALGRRRLRDVLTVDFGDTSPPRHEPRPRVHSSGQVERSVRHVSKGQSGARPHDLDVFAHHAGPSCRPGRGRRSRRQPTAASPLAGQSQPDVAQGAPERDLLRLALHQQGFGRPIAVALGDNDAMSIPEIRLLFQWHRHSLFHPVRRANSKLKAKRSDRVQAQARPRAIVSRSLAP